MAKKVPRATEDPTNPVEVNADKGEQTPPTEALKIIIQLRPPNVMIGVSQPGKDPHLVSLEMAKVQDLEQVLTEVAGIVAIARARWEAEPQYPKYTRPAAPPAPVRPGATPPTRRSPRVASSTPSVERPRMF